MTNGGKKLKIILHRLLAATKVRTLLFYGILGNLGLKDVKYFAGWYKIRFGELSYEAIFGSMNDQL